MFIRSSFDKKENKLITLEEKIVLENYVNIKRKCNEKKLQRKKKI